MHSMAPQSDEMDRALVEWANKRISELTMEQRKKADDLRGTAYDFPFEPLKSLGDKGMSNCLFFLHLMWAMEPRVINWSLITKGDSKDDQLSNAR
jgi:hypothetical protein